MREGSDFSCEKCFNKLLKRNTIFEDERYLDLNFTSKILHRQHELEQLMILYSCLLTRPGSRSVNQFVSGDVGVGKTATVKHFGKKLTEIASKRGVSLKYIHVNCRKEKTNYKILNKIIRSLKRVFPKRGFSQQDLIDIISAYLDKNDTQILLVLDDLDCLLEKDGDLLYSLTRINEDSIKSFQGLSIIGIIRDTSCLKTVYVNIRNFFQKNLIHFERYNKKQVFDILKYKARMCFKRNVVNDDIIKLIVEISEGKLDIRYGMNLLWRAGKVAENKNSNYISKEYILFANQEMSSFYSPEILKRQKKESLLFLFGLVKALNANGDPRISLLEVFDFYNNLCKKIGKVPKSYSQILNYLKEYKDNKIVNIHLQKGPQNGKDPYIKISNTPGSALENYLEELLNLRGVEF